LLHALRLSCDDAIQRFIGKWHFDFSPFADDCDLKTTTVSEENFSA
jgi:hypothetical protein